MAGRGRAPKVERRNQSDVPGRGEWQTEAEKGWQFGAVPAPPDGLLAATKKVWADWFGAWYAAHWTPDDVSQIEVAIKLLDAFNRGDLPRVTEYRLWCDELGILPKGAQDRRWVRPPASLREDERAATAANPYGHLKVAK